MNEVDTLLTRSRRIADHNSARGRLQPSLPDALPLAKAIIIGCADMRVDPAHILGLESGEAVVIRNIGGRVTPGLLAQLGMLGRIGQVTGRVPGGGGEFNIIILQHTDCGITRLTDDPAILGEYFQVEESALNAKSICDPRAAVEIDVAALCAVAGLPGSWLVSGLVYDIETGLIHKVVPARPIAG